MNEQDLRGLIEDVRRGKLSRRAFTRTMIALGLTAPMATQMLTSFRCGRGGGDSRSTSRPSVAAAER